MRETKKYSEELKTEALKMIIEQGMSQGEVGDLLSIPKGTIAYWVSKAKKALPKSKPGSLSISEIMTENRRLKKELKEAKMERDILKKAAAYFAKESK